VGRFGLAAPAFRIWRSGFVVGQSGSAFGGGFKGCLGVAATIFVVILVVGGHRQQQAHNKWRSNRRHGDGLERKQPRHRGHGQ
jgi:hypothetical protein